MEAVRAAQAETMGATDVEEMRIARLVDGVNRLGLPAVPKAHKDILVRLQKECLPEADVRPIDGSF